MRCRKCTGRHSRHLLVCPHCATDPGLPALEVPAEGVEIPLEKVYLPDAPRVFRRKRKVKKPAP